MSDRVAVVTGGNRGIGYALVKALCRQFDGAVYLTARNTDRGKAAMDELKKHGLNPKFHLLDISDHASIVTFKNHLKEKYRGLDLLISNAAISYPKDSTTPVSEQAEAYIKVNNFGASDLCAELFSLLRPNARVLIVSSGFGQLKNLKEKVRPKFNTDDMTVARLNEVLSEYVQSAKAGKLEEDGWPAWPNVVSKVGLHALARILARQISKDIFPGILVNAVCPGWTVTEATTSYLDKNGYFGDEKAKTPEEAVVDLLYVALLPPGTEEPQGKLVKYRKFLPYDE